LRQELETPDPSLAATFLLLSLLVQLWSLRPPKMQRAGTTKPSPTGFAAVADAHLGAVMDPREPDHSRKVFQSFTGLGSSGRNVPTPFPAKIKAGHQGSKRTDFSFCRSEQSLVSDTLNTPFFQVLHTKTWYGEKQALAVLQIASLGPGTSLNSLST